MNKRLACLCLCLGFLPFAVGCVEDAKADDKSKPADKASADPPSADPSKAVKKSPVEFSDLPVNDPLVTDAVRAREQIARLEEELLERLDELRAVLASAKADPDRLRQSVEQFVELTKDMRRKTTQAGDAIHTVGEKTAELSRSSRHLAVSYRALADLYRRKARDYSEKKLHDQLVGFAKDYDAVAASMPERCKTLDAVQKRLPALKRKVTEVNAFLGDATAFLNSHPGVGTEQRDQYAAEFESFAITFSEWLRVLDELRNALRERAVSKVIRESHRKDVAEWQKLELAKRDEQARLERAKQEELAKAEQARKEEESRQAKLAADERERLALERERLARDREEIERERTRLAQAGAIAPPPASSPQPFPTGRYQSVVSYPPVWSQRVVYPASSPCRCGTNPVYRRYP